MKGFRFKSSWGKRLQWDKINCYLRLGPVIVFELDTDWSNRWFSLAVLNFKITNK